MTRYAKGAAPGVRDALHGHGSAGTGFPGAAPGGYTWDGAAREALVVCWRCLMPVLDEERAVADGRGFCVHWRCLTWGERAWKWLAAVIRWVGR